MDHESLVVRAIDGAFKGMFATRPISTGEILWAEDEEDPRYHRQEIAAWPAEHQTFFLRWSYQIDDDWFAGPRAPDEVVDSDHMNHSCDPNAWWDGQRAITARRAITVGEQVTFDYATSDTRSEFSFPCACGTSLCRGTVRGQDFLTVPDLRARYGVHAQPFLLRRAAVFDVKPPLRASDYSWLHEAIELRPSPTAGFGLFATRPIEVGEVVWRGDPDEPLVHLDTIMASTPEQQEFYRHFACQIDDVWFSVPPEGVDPEPADYMNHSCDPTTWFVDAWTLVARRPIASGDEITYDYATSESAPWFSLDPCLCGTALCRGAVGPTDYRDSPMLQQRYGEHVLPYLRGHVGAPQAAAQRFGVSAQYQERTG
jgi:hypothetical protein